MNPTAPLTWRKSTRSPNNGGQCVEVGAWRTSTRSSSNGGSCVEVGTCTHTVAVRDTKDRSGPALTADRPQWTGFVAGLKSGAFDA